MVEVIYSENDGISLSVKGHAGSAPYGEDLVCASCSILFYTLYEILSSIDVGKCHFETSPGDAVAQVFPGDNREEVLTAFKHILKGFELLERAYPEYVKIFYLQS